MFCNKCGNEVKPNQKYCNKCGNALIYRAQKKENNEKINYINSNFNNKQHIVLPIVLLTIIITLIIGTIIYVILDKNENDYYFGDKNTDGIATQKNNPNNKTKKYSTSIIVDNVYTGISIKNIEDANKLIKEDSLSQRQEDYPKEIIQIENDIIEKYSITAVNLKEMDTEFAKEVENVIGEIYKNYPKARGYLTNLTLTNLNMQMGDVIALFMPSFMFGTSDTNTTRPWVIKTQVQLNAKFFLNPDRLKSATQASSKLGHFPKNATKYSPVAHEFGHYLSFIALLNHYNTNSFVVVKDIDVQTYYNILKDFNYGYFSKEMLDEAYQNYIKDNGNIDFDEWRGQISKYALEKDESGNYIYDETIAEAFHDVYLNGENASTPSKYIVQVLKKYIES